MRSELQKQYTLPSRGYMMSPRLHCLSYMTTNSWLHGLSYMITNSWLHGVSTVSWFQSHGNQLTATWCPHGSRLYGVPTVSLHGLSYMVTNSRLHGVAKVT